MTTLRSHAVQSFAFKYIPKSPRNEIHFIFQFLQQGTFLWLVHYEKRSISSKIPSHEILVHNKRSLEYLSADNAITVTVNAVNWFLAPPSADISCVTELVD